MGSRDYWKRGSINCICDRCGAKAKAEELVLEWTGYRVHRLCHEPRNQQDYLRAVRDNVPKPFYRPETPDVFIDYGTAPVGDFQYDDGTTIVYDDGTPVLGG